MRMTIVATVRKNGRWTDGRIKRGTEAKQQKKWFFFLPAIRRASLLAEEGSEMRGIHVVDHLQRSSAKKTAKTNAKTKAETETETKRQTKQRRQTLGFRSVSLRPFFLSVKF
jgi:hypothetical protein